MSDSTQNVVVSQANGTQGATTYGPRLRNKASPSKHGNQDFMRTIEIQLDGDVQTEQVIDPTNETQFAMPRGCLLESFKAYSSTGVAALVMGLEDVDGGGAAGNVYTGALAGVNWTVARDIDLPTATTSQITFSGLAAGEKATVYITFLQTATDGGEDGVLVKPRVVPA